MPEIKKLGNAANSHQRKSVHDTTGLEDWTLEIDGNKYIIRIRKLTTRECWRLMDFSDDDFDKAQAVNSNSQLYKQAGNSIVRQVLVDVFKKLLE